ncbi:uncharacterized protein TRIVIDRAFT_58069 [Trichoderma virens Gv29-8]|uniref:EGF-like domain-containing protein n=1 Tax=Hypocrea virens (strain Gv29-8 / FGSC 10586) TaxID=413071 RepID=G9MQ29_HYPVG|nr:uncharacterized protein TRIVIDRAFT_58069 [Trichoderma virens Gv29-8]EHK23978.1 hypothetical protein TRIVIDRAFT_58069 [Trichoderma virens Gv29-8]
MREQRLRHNASPSDDTPPQDVIPPNSTRSRPPNGQNGIAARTIQRPSPAPQWPLQSPPAASPPDADSYRPPPDRPRAPPQRPQRPSLVPSMVDQSRQHQPTPSFRVPGGPESPSEPVDSPSSETSAPPRRSANLGPPPSSRRGQSSFYSAASFVSPIPEEDSAYKSHNSYASSAAMPDAWRVDSAGASPTFHGAFYEESLTDRTRNSGADDYNDESGLVSGREEYAMQTLSNPKSGGNKLASANPFIGGTGLVDESTDSSTNTSFTNRQTPATTPGMASHIAGVALNKGNNTMDPDALRRAAGSPQPTSRLSAIRRPPRLDIDAVREAESRGSLTSLPDLIRRATRLASMIDKGKRPSSRLDELDFFSEKAGGDRMKRSYDERYQSGFSDMLAAFPPPVQTPQHTGRGPMGSWPLVPGNNFVTGREKFSVTPEDQAPAKPKGRRCCGLPLWGFILIILLMLCIIAAAVVVPLEYFVFKNLGNHEKSTGVNLDTCAKTLPCLNGGSGVVVNNTCSCICTNGFTGANCGSSGSAGCTTTNLIPTDGSSHINNVTLGLAIPRIIADSNKNFSIPLVGTSILAKFNTANLSCIAQNALVTFDGQSTRTGLATAIVQNTDDSTKGKKQAGDDSAPSPVLTSRQLEAAQGEAPVLARRASASSSSPSPQQTSLFTVTQEVLDFARTAVLYVLQEDSVDAANTAQTQLQQFFTEATQSITKFGSQVTVKEASSISIGGNRTVNLVDTKVNIGQGPVGGKTTSKRSLWDF